MKWGIRRYQNEDGSLTAAGKKHVGLVNYSQGKESKNSMLSRAMRVNDFQEKYEKTQAKVNKAAAKGNITKANKIQKKADYYDSSVNAFDIGLSKETKEYAKQLKKVKSRTSTATAVAGVFGALGAMTYTKIADKEYKSAKQAFDKSYESYKNTKLSDLESIRWDVTSSTSWDDNGKAHTTVRIK